MEYTKSVGSTRRKFKRSKSSRSSNASSRPSIKNKAIEEKIKVAQLIEESNFTEQKLKLECEAKRLEIEEKVPKLKQVTWSFGYARILKWGRWKRKNIARYNQMTDPNIALDKPYENWKEFKSGKKFHYSDSLFRNGEPNWETHKVNQIRHWWGKRFNLIRLGIPLTHLINCAWWLQRFHDILGTGGT